MKTKILLTALLTFLLVTGKAFSNSSTLFIDVMEHPSKTYIIEFDDGNVYETQNDIRIDNLRFGKNGIRIYKRSFQGSRRNPRNFQDRLIYEGNLNVPRNSIIKSELAQRNLFVHSIRPKRANHPNGGRAFGMNQRAFEQLRFSVQNESFDRDKLEILTFVARTGNFNSRQVAELVSLMSFDSYKLKFAQEAYRNTVDKQNYFLVRDQITFISNQRKLMIFVSTQGPAIPPRGGNGRRR